MVIAYVFVAAIMTSAPVPEKKFEKLSTEERAAVRSGVYEGDLETESPERDGNSRVVVPKPVVAAHRKNATETEALLLKIVEGGAPDHAFKAVCYLLELRDGPGGGYLVSLEFDYSAWDKIDMHWKATPRDHWLDLLKDKKK
ncbi:MAG: hypothetical protein K2V38_03435 [Gemmataceae bacterium]|nr:hypothetical protein [Gemmataceae bacterium]